MQAPFTCIGWATPSYARLAEGIRADCGRLGYRYHLYQVDAHYASLVRAWCNHPTMIRRGILDFGCVLYLDIECRLLRPLPPHWTAPLVSVRHPPQKFWIRYNSGTVMANEACLPWIETWIAILEDWHLGELGPDDFVHWPGDLCDELALAAALAAHGVKVAMPELEYVDRDRPAELARGLWRNAHTVVQHPTIHHWPKVDDPTESKKLFWQNYPGDPGAIGALFRAPGGMIRRDGWVFETERLSYAPVEFWDSAPRRWIFDEVRLSSAQR